VFALSKSKLSFTLGLLLILLVLPLIQSSEYNHPSLYNLKTGTFTNSTSPSFYLDNMTDCFVGISDYGTYSTVSYPILIGSSYYSPQDTLISQSSYSLYQDITCVNLGNDNNTNQYNNQLEVYVSHDSTDSGDNSIKTDFSCSGSNRYVVLASGEDFQDSKGKYPNVYVDNTCGTFIFNESIRNNFISNFSLCGGELSVGDSSLHSSCHPNDTITSYFMPFNSSGGGTVSIKLDLNHPITNVEVRYIIFPLDNPDNFEILYYGTEDTPYNGQKVLEENKIYVIHAYTLHDNLGSSITLNYLNVTLDAYIPDWNCGEYSDCIDGLRTRSCYDNNGVKPDKNEIQVCSIIELENLTLGFEEFFVDSPVVKCVPTWFFGCGHTPQVNTIDRPIGWTVVERTYVRDNFVQMTNDWSSEGTRSLKMWYIPPKQAEPFNSSFIIYCDNSTIGKIPQIYKGINDSFFVSKNITFPATNMIISFDIKKCKDNVLQHGALRTVFDIELCPKICYGNCSEEPKGRFFFNIQDLNDSKSILPTGYGWFDEAEKYQQTFSFDLSDLGIDTSHVYNIVFAVTPENFNDNNGFCVMFDNVRYSVLRDPITCVSECVGVDYFKRSLVNNSCVIEITDNSPDCLTSEQRDLREKCKPYCDGTNKYFPTDDCVEDVFLEYEKPIPNHPDCIEEEEDRTIYTPLIETDEEWINNFITPFMIIFYIVIIIITGVAIKTKSWQLGTLVGFLLLIAVGTVFEELRWIVIIFIVVGGLLFAREFNKHKSGGDN